MLRIFTIIYFILLVGCSDGAIEPVVSDQADFDTRPTSTHPETTIPVK